MSKNYRVENAVFSEIDFINDHVERIMERYISWLLEDNTEEDDETKGGHALLELVFMEGLKDRIRNCVDEDPDGQFVNRKRFAETIMYIMKLKEDMENNHSDIEIYARGTELGERYEMYSKLIDILLVFLDEDDRIIRNEYCW